MAATTPPAGFTVLYAEQCPLCRRLRAWLAGQPTLDPVTFVPAASAEARRRFPRLDHERTTRVLTVVAADGAVYEDERAWLLCAWMLPGWRTTAQHFNTPGRQRAVRVAARMVDRYRRSIIGWNDYTSDEDCHCSLVSEGTYP